ncbi:hypothetical protein BDQ17DRAFT_1331211 [Cyathus striatus]|nr:hypothetical protein BDQ17DRAFT_1331211 [Cyathus striatus]
MSAVSLNNTPTELEIKHVAIVVSYNIPSNDSSKKKKGMPKVVKKTKNKEFSYTFSANPANYLTFLSLILSKHSYEKFSPVTNRNQKDAIDVDSFSDYEDVVNQPLEREVMKLHVSYSLEDVKRAAKRRSVRIKMMQGTHILQILAREIYNGKTTIKHPPNSPAFDPEVQCHSLFKKSETNEDSALAHVVKLVSPLANNTNILSYVNQTALENCGLTLSDAIQLKCGAQAWLDSPEVKKPKVGTPSLPPPISPSFVQANIDYKICFEKCYCNGDGSRSYFRSHLIPGKNKRQRFFHWWYFDPVLKCTVHMPKGFVPNLDPKNRDDLELLSLAEWSELGSDNDPETDIENEYESANMTSTVQ